METIHSFFKKFDNLIGVNDKSFKTACSEDKEMFFECVMASECF